MDMSRASIINAGASPPHASTLKVAYQMLFAPMVPSDISVRPIAVEARRRSTPIKGPVVKLNGKRSFTKRLGFFPLAPI